MFGIEEIIARLDTSLEIAQIATILFGLFAAAFAGTWAIYFWTNKDTFGRILSFMLIGEAIATIVAVYFAVNSFLHLYNNLSPWEALSLRVVIFTVTCISTIKLVLYLRTIEQRRRVIRSKIKGD